MAVQVVTEAPRRQRPEVMPRVKEEVVGMVHFETDGLPLAAYWNRREDLPVTHPVPRARRWQLGSKPCPLLRQGGVSGPGSGG
jgi:hypothetical protein